MSTKENLIALYTIVRKEYDRIIRIWMQTLLPPAITMSLYFLIFGKLVGSKIGNIDSYSYIDFIIPGLIMMSVITNSYNNVVSSFFMMKFQKSIEELLVSTISPILIVIGYSLGGVVRGLLVGIIVLGVSFFFTNIQLYNVWIFSSIIFLTSLLFSLAGLTNAILANKFDDISIIPTFILTPLTYLGGIFYSVNNLPDIWKSVSTLNPILYMVNAFRYGFLGITDVNIFISYLIVSLLIVFLFLLNYYLIKTGYKIKQ
jgi:ABC-2 type transport system permease protein